MPTLETKILTASGQEPAELVLKNARFLNVFTGEFDEGDIAIQDGEIVGIGESYMGYKEIDLTGKTIVPGFIDGHRHIESNLTPEIDRAILPRGTTTLIWDPHEMANVMGTAAIAHALKIAESSPMDIFVNLPSCVPATNLGTSGAKLEIEHLLPFAGHPKVIGLAELMNIGGVLGLDPAVLAKAKAFWDVHIDGHLPGILGKNLSGMIACGVSTDHESTSAAEAGEKLSKGVHVLARAGSAAQNIPALAALFKPATAKNLGFCTDDRNPDDIAREGDIDHAIRTAIAGGADPASAYIAAGYGTAQAFGLTRNHPKFGTKRGAIAPGWLADLVILDDVKTCKIDSVMKRGKIVGPQTFAQKLTPQFEAARQTVKIGPVTAADFAIPSAGKAVACEFPQDGIPEREKTRAIGLIPGQIVSQALWANVPHHKGFLQATTDVSKLVVMERHGINGNVSKGFITDFGFKPGSWALASTVSHDDHNLVIAGTDDESMAVAANHLRQTGGGYVAVKDGKVIASLDLPLYGLMSDKTPDVVAQELRTLIDTTREQLGGELHDPFQTLAFVSLSVIPTIKLTDKGLTMFDPANGDQGPRLI